MLVNCSSDCCSSRAVAFCSFQAVQLPTLRDCLWYLLTDLDQQICPIFSVVCNSCSGRLHSLLLARIVMDCTALKLFILLRCRHYRALTRAFAASPPSLQDATIYVDQQYTDKSLQAQSTSTSWMIAPQKLTSRIFGKIRLSLREAKANRYAVKTCPTKTLWYSHATRRCCIGVAGLWRGRTASRFGCSVAHSLQTK